MAHPTYEAYEKEFYTNRLERRTEHIRDIRMNGQIHNNKMERMNGELDRLIESVVCVP